MPELPEVETTRRGIESHILDREITRVVVREKKLRWPVPLKLSSLVSGQQVLSVKRRAKYLLINLGTGTLMIHLGMSGSLRIVASSLRAEKHDHVDFELRGGNVLRYRDPRKFGSILWIDREIGQHPLLVNLGPEPLTEDFSSDYLYALSRKRKVPVKSFIMDSHVVVGVGNIYANEALFWAGIRPTRQVGTISKVKYQLLVATIKEILAQAIEVGGTTLRDFTGGNGEPGYFKQSLAVYGRGGEPCVSCNKPLKEIRQGQRSTVYCTGCQR
jgi:formamidopyrimidine-DNA glycosylase